MKKIKFILPVIVFVFAFAMSFASGKLYNPQETEFYWQTTAPSRCIQITPVCNRFGEFACTVVSPVNGGPFVVYGHNIDASVCAIVLRDGGEIKVIP